MFYVFSLLLFTEPAVRILDGLPEISVLVITYAGCWITGSHRFLGSEEGIRLIGLRTTTDDEDHQTERGVSAQGRPLTALRRLAKCGGEVVKGCHKCEP